MPAPLAEHLGRASELRWRAVEIHAQFGVRAIEKERHRAVAVHAHLGNQPGQRDFGAHQHGRVTHEVLGVRRLCLRAAQDWQVAGARRLHRAAQLALGKECIEPVVTLDQRDRVARRPARQRREHRTLGRAIAPLGKGRGGFGPVGEQRDLRARRERAARLAKSGHHAEHEERA